MSAFLLLFLIILVVNMIPAFGPPTWSVLVLVALNTKLPIIPAVIIGASAPALGRYSLALVFRALGAHLSERSRRNLTLPKQMVEQNGSKSILGLALFALSPLPSAQLFEAAGLLGARLFPFTAAFFTGRLVSYFIYTSTAAKIRETSIGDAFRGVLSQPLGIALQVVLIAALFGLTRVDLSVWLTSQTATQIKARKANSPADVFDGRNR